MGLAAFLLGTAFAFAFANPRMSNAYDYQFRIARALLHGELGLHQGFPWLNEMVPFEGRLYSVFPFGSILCHVPVALMQHARGNPEYPAHAVVALTGMFIALFALALSDRYKDGAARRALLVIWLLWGTWLMPNMVFGSAWQVALGLAVLGEFGALTFVLTWRNPFLAGFCFAIAFGNRTELLLTAPLYIYLLTRRDPWRDGETAPGGGNNGETDWRRRLLRDWRSVAWFCVCPFLLGVATLWYNAARFHNPLDFGYARIPGVLDEYWYQPGIFSWQAIAMNVRVMLCDSAWNASTSWPYILPTLRGGSILSICPFLLYLVRPGQRDMVLRRVCWLAIALLLAPVLPHGNSGGMQFAYRYALPLLPWIWLLLLDRRGGRITAWEGVLFAVCLFANGWAVYVWFWTPPGSPGAI